MGWLCAVFNQVQQKTITGIVYLHEPMFVFILVVENRSPDKRDSVIAQL